MRRPRLVGLALGLLLSTTGAWGADMTLEQLRAQRRELAHKPRRIIFNNDGCDALYYPVKEPFSVDGFLSKRTSPLAGSQVGTIDYCSISSGFSNFTHQTKLGTVLTRDGGDYGVLPTHHNITDELIAAGTDALRAVLDWGHQHETEVFWSFRMNDTHDAAHTTAKPYLLYPPLKVQHPDWLVGDEVKRTPYGRWSSVNYALPEIRDLAFGFTEEVCRNYDVDGIELDYFRHLCYFPEVANGKVATEAEVAAMTDLMRRIRKMTEAVGLQRGRPILVTIRVPDSVEFCRDMGFDLETWLSEDLVDILVTTGYFRLNPWSYTIDLAHRHGKVAYPCLSDSRVQGETRFRRHSLESYRGRAMNIWAAGADGVYTFNYFHPDGAVFREAGDPAVLAKLDKLYFVTCRDGNPSSWLANGAQYQTTPLLVPARPQTLAVGQALTLPLEVGDDLAQAPAGTKVVLHLELPALRRTEQIAVQVNGQTLGEGTITKGWLDLPVPPAALNRGTNTVALTLQTETPRTDEWTFSFDGQGKPTTPWRRDRGSKQATEEPGDDGLFIADRGTDGGDYLYYRYDWAADPAHETVTEARVKVKSGSSYLILGNGKSQQRVGLWPDRVELWSDTKQRYAMDTTDRFHDYKVVTNGTDIQVWIDGELRIDGKGKFAVSNTPAQNTLAFGAANSPQVGEAWWAMVRGRAAGQIVRDLALSITFPKSD